MSDFLFQAHHTLKSVRISELLTERERLAAEIVLVKRELRKKIEAAIAILGVCSIFTLIINFVYPNLFMIGIGVVLCTLIGIDLIKAAVNLRKRSSDLQRCEQVIKLAKNQLSDD